MILRIETESTAMQTMVVIHKRNKAGQSFMPVKKSFLKPTHAQRYIENQKKNTLIAQLKQYLKDCRPIIRSTKRRQQLHAFALQELKQLNDIMEGRYGIKDHKYLGKAVLRLKKYLKQILPEKMDPAYRICYQNYNEIIEQAQLCAERKRVTQS